MLGLGLFVGASSRARATAQLRLSASTVVDTAVVDSTVGALSVAGGSGSYTYTLTSDPSGLFSISVADLKTAAALTAGSYSITVQADNGVDTPISRVFLITVTSSASATSHTGTYLSQGIY